MKSWYKIKAGEVTVWELMDWNDWIRLIFAVLAPFMALNMAFELAAKEL